MKLATAAEMRELDRRAIEDIGIPGVVLMENAGRGVVGEMLHAWGPVRGRKYDIFCGKGNNGGDGLVIARHLHNRGATVRVWLFSEDMKGDAGVNLKAARNMGLDIKVISKGLKAESSSMRHSDAVIDAIFGTGLAKDVSGHYKKVIDAVNRDARRVLAVDIPSGVDSDKGRIMGVAVRADMTVTFGLPKRGLYLYPGAQFAGDVRVADISIPAGVIDDAPVRAGLITAEQVRGLMPKRSPEAHKGSFGHLFILAGSVGKTGAACLAAEAALRTGVGLVTLGVPEGLNPIFEEKLTEAMTVPLPQTEEGSLAPEGMDRILSELKGKSALVLGPGISTNAGTMELVAELLPKLKVPTLIDADGLNILAIDDEPLKNASAPVVLTPHPGEMSRLIGVLARDVQADRPDAAVSLAGEYGHTVVLKGARTLVALPDGTFHINPTGNAGMATAGTGDVLSGVIGSLLAQGLGTLDASMLGVYLHGHAGDIASNDRGEAGLIAGDIIESLPESMRLMGT